MSRIKIVKPSLTFDEISYATLIITAETTGKTPEKKDWNPGKFFELKYNSVKIIIIINEGVKILNILIIGSVNFTKTLIKNKK